MTITPAILPHSFEEITEKLSRIEGISPNVQIDICDGVFGREKTWLPTGAEILPDGFRYEFDLMLNDCKTYVPLVMAIGAKCIVAHVDTFSDEDLNELVEMVKVSSVSLGIAVSNDKDISFHSDMIRKVKDKYSNIFIQVMGIENIGEQGQAFDQTSIERVKELKQQFGDIKLQVDGGMTPETAKLVKEAGADTIVVGSYIFGNADAGAALEILNTSFNNN